MDKVCVQINLFKRVVIPAKAGIQFFDKVSDFRRDDVWMPDQVRYDEITKLMERHQTL